MEVRAIYDDIQLSPFVCSILLLDNWLEIQVIFNKMLEPLSKTNYSLIEVVKAPNNGDNMINM